MTNCKILVDIIDLWLQLAVALEGVALGRADDYVVEQLNVEE